jgi:curved DNA-binding protein CbpA
MYAIKETELLDACKLIFGSTVRVDRSFLEYIQPSGVKSAYRKKALETHPDRYAALGHESQRRHTEHFRAVNEAYETISRYMKMRQDGFKLRQPVTQAYSWRTQTPAGQSASRNAQNGFSAAGAGQSGKFSGSWRSDRPGSTSSSTASSTASWNSTFSQGRGAQTQSRFSIGANKTPSTAGASPAAASDRNRNLPRRQLRIGEYLYYAGLIAWKDLIAAIVWQTKQRQRVGEIAARWGWISEGKILELLRQRQKGERIGDLLVRMKVISPFQRNMITWQQQKSQVPIGEYFVKNQLVPDADIKRFLKHLKDHNVGYPESSKAK